MGDMQRSDEVGTGRGTGKYALGARSLAGRLERLGFRDGDDFVVVGGAELRGRWPMPPPSMWWIPGGPPDSTADSARLDGGPVHCGQ